MFGNDNGNGDGGHDGPDWGQALFAFLLFRELQSGRTTPGQVTSAGCGMLLAVLIMIGAFLAAAWLVSLVF